MVSTSARSSDHRLPVLVAAVLALSWLGLYIHNRADLPQLTALSPEHSVPGLVAIALFLAWWPMPARRLTAALLLAWGLLHLIGGGLSVLPLPFLPFEPEQTGRHYAFHALYGAAQLPLIGLSLAQFGSARRWRAR